MTKQEINQDIRITDKAYKKHGLWGLPCGLLKYSFTLHLKQNPSLSNTKVTHSLFEPITQMEDIV